MGNEIGKSNARLGICAIAHTTTNIEKAELSELAKKMSELVQSNINSAATATAIDPAALITKLQLEQSLKSITKFNESDTELFTNLFTMFDNSGEGVINYREFMAGIAGCLITGSLNDKLVFALQIYYPEGQVVEVSRGDTKKVLNSLNNVASFFGDPVVSPDMIDTLVLELFSKTKSTNGSAPLEEWVKFVEEHSLTEVFVSGKGNVRFGR